MILSSAGLGQCKDAEICGEGGGEVKNMQSEVGEIYILTNPAMPGYIKIGFTAGKAEDRAVDLSRDTAVPLPFSVEFTQMVENPIQYERLIHARLAAYRVREDREFFKVAPETAENAIRHIVFGSEEFDFVATIKHMLALAEKHPDRIKSDSKKMDQIKALLGTATK